jgi:biotin transport system substrate-specific component
MIFMTETVKKPMFTTKELCLTALGAALMAICAWISIPTEVPFTLQTFAVFLVTGLLGLKCGTLSVVVYLLLGAVGLPVFAGFKGGLGSLVGVTGGYLVGFIFTALAVGTVTRFFGRSFPALIAGMVLGLVLCYAFGSLWFLLLYTSATGPIAMSVVLAKCVIPFLLPDAVKIALAAILVTRLKNLVP